MALKETCRRRGWLTRFVGGLAVALVVVGSVAWIGGRTSTAAEHLTRAAALFQQIRGDLLTGRVSDARDRLIQLRRHTTAAVAQTRDPGWRIGTHVVGLGDDLAAVATVAAVLNDLALRGLPPLIEAADQVNPATLAPRDGRVALAPLTAAAPHLMAADAAMRGASQRVAAIRTGGLDDRVRTGVVELRSALSRAASITGAGVRAARLVPALLGARGPRTYLMLFQNLAEPRATGGLPGAFVVVSAHRGVVRFVGQGSAAVDLQRFDRPVLRVREAMRELYTDRLTTFPGDANFTPHFPTAAAVLREMYRRRTGRTVDGVLATDPVALSYLLRAVGSVRTPDGGSLTAGNAVRTLLSDVYGRTGANDEQDRYFAGVARTVFDRLIRLPSDPAAVLAELSRAAGERRLLVWSAHATEQRLIAGTVLEGALPERDGSRPTVGVFLNDGGGSKLGYYLTRRAELATRICRPNGRREILVRVTLGSTAPRSGLPRSVLGLGLAGDPYTLRLNVLVFSPAGGAVGRAWLDGRPVGLWTGNERGRAVGVVTVDLRPGTSRTLEVSVWTAERTGGNAVAPRLWLTPGTRPWALHVHSAPPC